MVIEYPRIRAHAAAMLLRPLSLASMLLLSGPAGAACFADYKAKQDNPLRLHYGVAEIPGTDCTSEAAARHLQSTLAQNGWQLLNVMSVFDDSGLGERRSDAGQFYLRF